MTDAERAALEAERNELTRKLQARDGQPGYLQNCADIRTRLAELAALLDA